ncbi:hypothetical protein QY049_03965 [Bradyrhizobium sp. WYCCWR 13022]|uniref:hypothetical protein n=1 Tax=unclassified Bradyrhizobium TaxID=2631580 RepID=UPI00263AAD11|nr:hypothetical protein [Bradyrhizobium sp. WYCCWR 13022]MDN4982379.1 hypothetical protein [Bradyrhizobium sp. WYCCWR 13022]
MNDFFPVAALLVSGLALIVSALSLFLNYRTAQRAKAEKAINAWIVLSHRLDNEWWLAKLSVKNNSHLDIAIEKIAVAPPDFLLGDYSKIKLVVGRDEIPTGFIALKDFDRYLAMPLSVLVSAGDTTEAKFLLHQPSYSRRKGTKVRVMYWTQEPKRKWCILPVAVLTRSDF